MKKPADSQCPPEPKARKRARPFPSARTKSWGLISSPERCEPTKVKVTEYTIVLPPRIASSFLNGVEHCLPIYQFPFRLGRSRTSRMPLCHVSFARSLLEKRDVARV